MFTTMKSAFGRVGARFQSWLKEGPPEAVRRKRLLLAIVPLALVSGAALFFKSPAYEEKDGVILLESPQIFTRGRLVNDRAAEQAWLEDQLERTKELVDNDRFAKPDFIRFARKHLAAALSYRGDPARASTPSTDGELAKRLATVGLFAPPLEQFEDAARYREAIRNVLMSTALDDRHDIEGNTIYRLNFTVSVMPRRGSDRLAVTLVQLSESAGEKDRPALRNAYVELLHDWREKINENIQKVVTDRLDTLNFGHELQADENEAFTRWLAKEAQRVIGRALEVNDTKAASIFRELQLTYNLAYRRLERSRIEHQLLTEAPDLLKKSGLKMDDILNRIIDECPWTGQFDAGSLLPRAVQEDARQQPPRVRCNKRSALLSDIDILDAVAVIDAHAAANKSQCKLDREFLVLVEWAALEHTTKPDTGCQEAGARIYEGRRMAELSKRRLSIIALFEGKYQLEKPAKSDLKLQGPDGNGGDTARLKHFFKPSYSGDCVLELCTLQIMFVQKDVSALADLLIDLLAGRMRAFTYAVMPNKAVERAEIGERASSDVSVGAGVPAGGSASGQHVATSDVSGRQQDATVLGFGDWNALGRKASVRDAATKFGWAMYPRSVIAGGTGKQQVAESYSVSAIVSLPGWWKTAHLAVWTCWASEDEVRQVIEKMSCPGETQRAAVRRDPDSFDLRLPGDAQELMQQLRFEVLRTPYIESRDVYTVEAGRKANLIIRGGRLWRSPVVSLGNQKADRIEVLPDMKGIIAHFKCIRPAPGLLGVSAPGAEKRNEPPAPVDLQVVTSEGTPPSRPQVWMQPFTLRQGETEQDACWREEKLAAAAKSSTRNFAAD